MRSKSSAWIIILIVFAVIAGAVWYFAAQKPAPTRQTGPQSFGEEIGGQIKNPGAALPETNPFEAVKTNPFEGGYKNPFSE